MDISIDLKKIAQFYDTVASEYDKSRNISGGRLFNEYIEMPAVMSLIPQRLDSKKVLDIGCGIGAYTYNLGMKGAEITAIDISSEMLKIAEAKCSDSNIHVSFINTSFQDYKTNYKFDLIVGGFMLGYFDDLEGAFKKISLMTERTGSCILSMIHPIKLSSIARENGNYLLDSYFDKMIYKSDLAFSKEEISLKKWNFSDISEAAYKTGLYLDRIIEPVPTNTPLTFDKELLEFYNRCPSVLVISLKRRRQHEA